MEAKIEAVIEAQLARRVGIVPENPNAPPGSPTAPTEFAPKVPILDEEAHENALDEEARQETSEDDAPTQGYDQFTAELDRRAALLTLTRLERREGRFFFVGHFVNTST